MTTSVSIAAVKDSSVFSPQQHAVSLSAFIAGHHEAIINEFAVFAKTLTPSGMDMTEVRDQFIGILSHDLRTRSGPSWLARPS
jgi:hypothetical protein